MKQINSNISGITYRTWESFDDYVKYADMLNAYNKKFNIDRIFTAKSTQKWFEGQKGFNPKEMFLVAEKNNMPVAMQAFYASKEMNGPHIFFHESAVSPEYADSHLIAELLGIVLSKIKKAANELEGEESVYTRSFLQDREEHYKKVLEENDYSIARYFFEMKRDMKAEIPERKLPDGLKLRPASTKEEIIQVMKANDVAFQDHWGHTSMTDEFMYSWMEQDTFTPELWKVAWDGDQIAGSILNFLDKNENKILGRKRGYTEEITTQRAYRGKGVASALITESIKMFQEMDMDEVALSVDTGNPSGALGLYESFGYQAYKQMVAMGKKIR